MWGGKFLVVFCIGGKFCKPDCFLLSSSPGGWDLGSCLLGHVHMGPQNKICTSWCGFYYAVKPHQLVRILFCGPAEENPQQIRPMLTYPWASPWRVAGSIYPGFVLYYFFIDPFGFDRCQKITVDWHIWYFFFFFTPVQESAVGHIKEKKWA